MDLTKRIRGVIADIIRGNYFFSCVVRAYIDSGRIDSSSRNIAADILKKFLTDAARYY